MKYAIFDLDGTLADSMPYWKQLYLEYLKQRGVASPPLDTMIQASPMTAREAAAFFAQTFGLSDTPDQAVVEFNRLMEEHYRGDVRLKPGVPEFLRALQAAGVTMCVASATAGPPGGDLPGVPGHPDIFFLRSLLCRGRRGEKAARRLPGGGPPYGHHPGGNLCL